MSFSKSGGNFLSPLSYKVGVCLHTSPPAAAGLPGAQPRAKPRSHGLHVPEPLRRGGNQRSQLAEHSFSVIITTERLQANIASES